MKTLVTLFVLTSSLSAFAQTNDFRKITVRNSTYPGVFTVLTCLDANCDLVKLEDQTKETKTVRRADVERRLRERHIRSGDRYGWTKELNVAAITRKKEGRVFRGLTNNLLTVFSGLVESVAYLPRVLLDERMASRYQATASKMILNALESNEVEIQVKDKFYASWY